VDATPFTTLSDFPAFQQWSRITTLAALALQPPVIHDQLPSSPKLAHKLLDVVAPAMHRLPAQIVSLQPRFELFLASLWTTARDIVVAMERDLTLVRGRIVLGHNTSRTGLVPTRRLVGHHGLGLAFIAEDSSADVVVKPQMITSDIEVRDVEDARECLPVSISALDVFANGKTIHHLQAEH
jgi:hypothetical protein